MLGDDLVRWFDDELWRVADGSDDNRFALGIAPEELLVDAPTAIWPALMPCDFLPILGNAMGDWLCVRIADDDRANQLVHWYHGGGDWIPWGDRLAEAIFFDQVRHRLPGNHRDHAVAAYESAPQLDPICQQLYRWASDRLQDRTVVRWDELHGNDLADAMLEHQISRPAVLCHLVIDALDNPLLANRSTGNLGIGNSGIGDADAIQHALLDNRRLDETMIRKLISPPVSIDAFYAQQDWDAVARYSEQVTGIDPKLAWGWDLLGYSHERQGAQAAAVECYRNGLRCSIFTDQTVRVRTHGLSTDGQKVSATRLINQGYSPSDATEKAYFDCLQRASPSLRRDKVREHFSHRAQAVAEQDAGRAYELWIRAGWDLGAEPMAAFAELLEHAADSALAAGRAAQSELARTHRNCFRDRYQM